MPLSRAYRFPDNGDYAPWEMRHNVSRVAEAGSKLVKSSVQCTVFFGRLQDD